MGTGNCYFMEKCVSAAKQEVGSHGILVLGTGKNLPSLIGSISSLRSCAVQHFTRSCLNKDKGGKHLKRRVVKEIGCLFSLKSMGWGKV